MLRAALAERADTAPTESELETRFVQLCRRAGLPQPVRQHEVRDHRGLVGRCDFAYLDARVIIELDGYATHSGREDHRRDLARQNATMLARPDWVILRYSWDDVVRWPSRVVTELRGALGR